LENRNFKLINGGLLDTAETSGKTFVSAYMSNSRLMGVVAMYVHWKLPDNDTLGDLHQFFYFDAEEFGFDSYESVLGSDHEELERLESTIFGGLGSIKADITERQALYMLQQYYEISLMAGFPLPEGMEEYGFMLNKHIEFTDDEEEELMGLQCTEIASPFELVNYFLMRCFSKDFPGAEYLAPEMEDFTQYNNMGVGTLYMNKIRPGDSAYGYTTESLVDCDESYYIVVSGVTTDTTGKHVTHCERVSSYKISPAEAALIMARSEFVTVYEVLGETTEFNRNATPLTKRSVVTEHDNGKLYMVFHTDNSHVNKKIYRLNEDVSGIYYMTNGRQLIAAAYTLEEIQKLELDLGSAPVGHSLLPVSRYEFQEPVLYEFVNSGFDDFEEFVDTIKSGE